MFKRFLKENNIEENIITRDIYRLIRKIDLIDYSPRTKYTIFNELAKIYIGIERHTMLLLEMGGKAEKMGYFLELDILERFIRYLIKHFRFEQDFISLVERNKRNIEYVCGTEGQVNINNTVFDTIEVGEETENINTDEKDAEMKDILEILDLEE
ncbi:hypothetical protein HZF24_05030 [Sedimentibacter hydroxybenzoicus DSM 7310]|uniref:Uncharacterized protein n=1 Tax=Sedimentibacter hydroxybenzoicus DSM 7310 TaxID=1123245 RepID=A0A974BI27_SEDHY|nr:hypothetical protein [Sedimentibacter hydroxybenzoicus]NYB73498.1 hypothetical protein [Sedimentibacter hydroxybenzoicus DSM 7310]